MAFMDDPEFIIAHIRHSCVITDDTGMCEQVILNEEIENEKVIKHRRNIKIGRYAMDRDIIDFPSYPQSFDIAVSPDPWKYSKSQGKGDRNRRERNTEVRCKTVSWKEGENVSVKMSAEDLSDVFGKREVKQDKSKAVPVSQLSRQLEESLGKPNNPFLEYSKFEGEKDTTPAKPTPPKPSSGIIVTAHEPQHGFSRVKVESMNTRMKQVYEKMIKKRGLKRTANEYVLEKQSEPGVPINVESTLESMGTMEFCLVRSGRPRPVDDHSKEFPDVYAYYQFQTYRVSMLQKLRPVTEIQLSVSQERIWIDPVLQPKAAKTFWGKQKFTSVNMENVVACDLMDEKSNGKTQFRIVYFSQNARDYTHYDFETEANVAGEIAKKVTHIIKSNISGKRSEYLALKEKKLEKRRSFKY